MTRPTILDLDLVVVPREATVEMQVAGNFNHDQSPEAILSAMLSASPYPTAWDDVRKYVEGLERERYALAYAIAGGEDAPGLLDSVEASHFVEMARDNARRHSEEIDRSTAAEGELHKISAHLDCECDSDSILHSIGEAEADRDIYKDRTIAAEARIAELEKRLADAERVIERVPPYLVDMYKAICNGNEMAASGFAEKDNLVGLARAYMEGK